MRNCILIKHKKSTANVFVLLSILVLFITNCSPSYQQFGIIFSANLDGNQDVYNASSQNFQSLERLTHTSTDFEQNLKVAKNGTRILFSVLGIDLGWDAYVLDLRAKTTTSFVDPALGLLSIKSLSWSIDENQVVLFETQTRELVSISIDKKNVKKIQILHTINASVITNLVYSPDGEKVAYTEYHNTSPQISILSSFVFDFKTKTVIPLIDNDTAICTDPKWSPNGKQILLYCDLSTDSITVDNHVYVLDVSDSDPIIIKVIADLPCGAQFFWSPGAKFSWSPDGKRFAAAYCKMDNDPYAISIFSSNGILESSLLTNEIPESAIYLSELTWSPDGQKILYIAGENENALNIYVINKDGTDRHIITNHPANYKDLSTYPIN